MEWWQRLAHAVRTRERDFDLLYHVGTAPAVPAEYDVPGLVALTFRLEERPRGGHVYVTTIDVAAALRLGARFGLDAPEALAMVDSHERVHVFLQLAGVDEAGEEAASRLVDAVWLSLRHPVAAERVRTGDFGLLAEVHGDFWEALVDRAVTRG